MIREPACSGLGHFTFAALILGIGQGSHPDRTDQPNEMRGAEAAKERRQFTQSGFQLKREADAFLAKELVARDEDTYQEPTKVTVAEFLMDQWLPAIRHSDKVRSSTFASYKGHVYKYIVPHLGSKRLRKLTVNNIDVFYGLLAKTENGRGGKCLSAKTRRNIHITLRCALGYAVDKDLIPRNPAARANKPGLNQHVKMKTWTSNELRTFLDSVADDPWAALWRTYASTGLRRGEALGLRWADVDFTTGRLRIERSLNSEDYQIVVGETKTGRGRNISMDPWTLKSLKKLRAAQTLAWGAAPAPKAWVFTDDGKPIHPGRVTARFKVLQGKLNAEIVKAHKESEAKGDPPVLPRVRLHDLRHTWATLALEAGVHVKVVSEQLGHATVAITMDTYSHVSPQVQEDASARVAALFSA